MKFYQKPHPFKFCQTLFLSIATLSLTLSPLTSATSLTDEQEDIIFNSDILFYDPNDNCTDPANTCTDRPTGDQITWIGDSYTQGAEKLITEKLSGVDLHFQHSKHFKAEVAGNESGLSIARKLKSANSIRPFLVFALGTNDQNLQSNAVDELIQVVGESTKIILTTARTANHDYSATNDILKSSAQKYSNISIADWSSAIAGKESSYISSDGIHPNKSGYELWVDTIYNTLPGNCVGSLSGNTNAEKIVNYLKSANIPGISDKPEVIAGILGNLAAESGTGMDPFIKGPGGRIGLIQTNNAELIKRLTDAGLSKYFHSSGTKSTAPQDAVDKGIQITLDWLIKDDAFAGQFKSNKYSFYNNLNEPANKTGTAGAQSYAELWLVTIERAVNGSDHISDPGVQKVVQKMYKKQYLYQGVKKRNNYAVEFYKQLSGSTASIPTSSSTISLLSPLFPTVSAIEDDNQSQESTPHGNTTASNQTKWSDGWIENGTFPGYTKEEATSAWLDETKKEHYSTPDKKPNKILLHSTEGTTGGISAYPSGNHFAAHFTIDAKNQKVSQHVPITKPSYALKAVDEAGPIQIEIVGFSVGHEDSEYNLFKFTAKDWDYIALLLIAISNQTGIPLSSSLSWEKGAPRLNESEFANYRGVLGHMHAPKNDHVDPGNIWGKLSEAIARNPDASNFVSAPTNICEEDSSSLATNGELKSGGMATLADADAFMQAYRDIKPRRVTAPGGKILTQKYGITSAPGCKSDLENCVAFVKYFINTYTTKKVTSIGNGSQVTKNLINQYGFTDGGRIPRPYAIFSVPSGTTMCGNVKCGHTGVVLGIDEAANKIIIGEAGCSQPISWTRAKEKKLSDFTNKSYTYAYTDNILKGL